MRDLSLRIILQLIANQFNNGIQSARSLLGDFSASARTSDSATAGFQQRLNGAVRSVLDLGGAVRSLIMGFSLLAIAVGVKELIQFADNLRLIEGRIKNASASSVEFAQNYAALVRISLNTGTAFAENANMFSRINAGMVAMGGTAQNTLRQVDLIAKGLRISNAGIQESASTIRQWSQAAASGLLRGDELNSIFENSPRIADGMGVSIGVMRAMGEAGELTFEKVSQALASQGKVLDAEFKALPITIGTSFEKIKTAFGQYVADADRGKGATAGLAQGLESVALNMKVVIDSLVTLAKFAGLAIFSTLASSAIGYVTALRTARLEQTQAAATAQAARQAAITNTQATLASAEASTLNTAAQAAEIQSNKALIAENIAQAQARIYANQAAILQIETAIASMKTTVQSSTVSHLLRTEIEALTVAEGQQAVMQAELSVLQQRNAIATEQLTIAQTAQAEATAALTAAQERLRLLQEGTVTSNIGLAASFNTVQKAAMSLLYLFMAWEAGKAFGEWLRGFQIVRVAAIYAIDAIESALTQAVFNMRKEWLSFQLFFTFDKDKQAELIASLKALESEFITNAQARQEAKTAMLDEEEATDKVKTATENLADTFKIVKTAEDTFKEKVREITKELNEGRVTTETYTKALLNLHDAMQMDMAKQQTPFEKAKADAQDKLDKATLSPRDYQYKQLVKTMTADEADKVIAILDKVDTNKLENKLEKGVTQSLKNAFDAATEKYKLPEGLNQAVSKHESNYQQFDKANRPLQPRDKFDNPVSNATGNMQVIPKWHPIGEIDKTPLDVERLKTDEAYNVDRGSQILASLLQKFNGDIFAALKAYKGGKNDAENADYAKQVLTELDKINGTELVKQFDSELKVNTSKLEAQHIQARGNIELTLAKATAEGTNTIASLERLKQQGEIGIEQYYDDLTKAQLSIATAKATATRAKLAELEQSHSEKTQQAAPEDLPKLNAQFAVDKAKISQDLAEISTQIKDIPAINLIKKQEELDKLAAIKAEAEHNAALDNVSLKEAQAQQQLDMGEISNEEHLAKLREFAAERLAIELALLEAKRRLLGEDKEALSQNLEAQKALMRGFALENFKIDGDIAKEKKKSIKEMFAPFENAIEQMTSGILTGQQSTEQAVKRSLGNILVSYISNAVKKRTVAVAEWAYEISGLAGKEAREKAIKTASDNWDTVMTARKKLRKALVWAWEITGLAGKEARARAITQASDAWELAKSAGRKVRLAGEWLRETLGFGTKETTKVAVKAASETAQTAECTIGEATRAEIETAANEKSALGDAWRAARGAYASTMEVIPPPFNFPLAVAAGAAAFAGTMLLGSAKQGEMRVEQDGQLFELHKDESVLPAGVADQFRTVVDIVKHHVNVPNTPYQVPQLPAIKAVNDLIKNGQLHGNWSIPRSVMAIPEQTQKAANKYAQDQLQGIKRRDSFASEITNHSTSNINNTTAQHHTNNTTTNSTAGDTHIHIHGIALSPESFFRQHADKITAVAKNQARNFVGKNR